MQATPEQIGQMLAFASQVPHHEACGLVLENGRVWQGRNIAANPRDQFEISDEDWAAASALGKVVGIWHSHAYGGPEPSMLDRAMCERTACDWHIVAPFDGSYVYLPPSGWQAPYEGRPYSYGVFDCWELVRDWYRRELCHDLPRLDNAPDGWWLTQDLVPALCEQAGFVSVAGELQRGDVLLFRCDMASKGSDHAAVYLGEGRMLHQLRTQESRITRYGGYWQRAITKKLRLKP